MIDLKLLRTDPQVVRDGLARRGSDIDLDSLIELDERHRRLIAEVEKGRAEQNAASKRVTQGSQSEKDAAIAEAKAISERFKGLEEDLKKVREEFESVTAILPNLIHPDAPAGSSDESNVVLGEMGEKKQLGFAALDHLAIGEALNIIDVERAAKVSGSRFGILKGKGALLEFALVRFAFDKVGSHGFEPVIPPVLVREEAMFGTGFLPTDEAQIYKTAIDDLYLAGTAEVPIASMHSGETFPSDKLPIKYSGFSTCFRREAGTYGKDTRGIIRLHQFDKVEMFVICDPRESEAMHQQILAIEEDIFSSLEIPYRVVEICAGELAASNYRKFDVEAWLPGADRWLEVTSCSNCTDFQARRLSIRMRADSGNELVHTLNGTAIAVQRAIVALLENHQTGVGEVEIPAALKSYCGFDSIGP